MTADLSIAITRTEGALVRVLGLAERRGFPPIAVDARPHGDLFLISLTVSATRPIELLARQLSRLFDVQDVAIAAPALCEVAK
ncbi:MAG: acetolactate synthase II small subunit [Myxococcota bacterium]|jgi:acetolactate synthase II small subunit